MVIETAGQEPGKCLIRCPPLASGRRGPGLMRIVRMRSAQANREWVGDRPLNVPCEEAFAHRLLHNTNCTRTRDLVCRKPRGDFSTRWLKASSPRPHSGQRYACSAQVTRAFPALDGGPHRLLCAFEAGDARNSLPITTTAVLVASPFNVLAGR